MNHYCRNRLIPIFGFFLLVLAFPVFVQGGDSGSARRLVPELVLDPGWVYYDNTSAFSIAAGARCDTKLCAFQRPKLSGNFIIGLIGSIDSSSVDGISFSTTCAYLDSGYTVLLRLDRSTVRLRSTIRTGVAYVSWQDAGPESFSGFGFALMPTLACDAALPFLQRLRLGAAVGYRMVFAGGESWGGIIPSITLGYIFD